MLQGGSLLRDSLNMFHGCNLLQGILTSFLPVGQAQTWKKTIVGIIEVFWEHIHNTVNPKATGYCFYSKARKYWAAQIFATNATAPSDTGETEIYHVFCF
jgi:hypothetical protein